MKISEYFKPLKVDEERCRQCLAAKAVEAASPGTIMADVFTMLEAIGPEGIPTGSKRGNLPPSVLGDLNEALADPIDIDLKRALLIHYPNLAGVFILLRVLRLVDVDGKRVRVNEDAQKRWLALNDSERYFALLEGWLFRADDRVLGLNDRERFHQILSNLRFLFELPASKWKRFSDRVHSWEGPGHVNDWNAQLQARFGFLDLKARPLGGRREGPRKSRSWVLWKAKRTEWGSAVAWALWHWAVGVEAEEEKREVLFDDWAEPLAFGELQPVFQPFFPEWRKRWDQSETGARPGVYRFEISLASWRTSSRARRTLAVPGKTTLDDLADAVLDAFDFFDREHAHLFRYRDETGREHVYFHPFCEEGPYSDEVAVEETGLPKGETMVFKFDFGANWPFKMRLVGIDPPDETLVSPIVVSSRGGEKVDEGPFSDKG